ncbi:MAG: phosphotransferase, partial [Anaerolineaceae bacterium]|nr:phosphotransferase [Anaerolineaceae bacterium]
MKPLDLLENIEHYRKLFTSVAFWEPYVQEVCRRHNLVKREPVRIGVPGTCPTFIVGERWVIKFFGRLFEGQTAFLVEREAGRLVALDPAIPAAQVVAHGELGSEGWSWPYLIYPFLPGISVGELADHISEEDWLRIAHELGQMIKRLHALPLEGSPVFPDNLSAYSRFLETQRATCTANQRE